MKCRLCGGETEPAFTGRVLDKFVVGYHRCRYCEGLQTERPHWLDEAYAATCAPRDTGVVRRSVDNCTLVYRFLTLFGRTDMAVLDYGGGLGILCRLLRDWRVECVFLDRYSGSGFADPYRVDAVEKDAYGLITAFEVMEHFANPAEDLPGLFDAGADLVLASTELADVGTGADWPYLDGAAGQHVFFYTKRTMAEIASRFGYVYRNFGNVHAFLRAPPSTVACRRFEAGRKGYGKLIAEFRLKVAMRLKGVDGAHEDAEALTLQTEKEGRAA